MIIAVPRLPLMSRLVCSLLVAVALPATVRAAFDVPKNDGFVTDQAGILTETEHADLELRLNEYRQKTSNEIAVVTIKSLSGAEIGQAALDIYRAWRVGSQSHDNGIVVLFAYDDRQVWISVGYGLEAVVPDLTAFRITEDVMKPLMKEGKYGEALNAAVDKLESAIGGEYKPEETSGPMDIPSLTVVTLFVGLNVLRFFGAWMAKSRSWWHGGVIGLIAGALLAIILRWWLTIPLLIIAGLAADYIVSRYGFSTGRQRGFLRRGTTSTWRSGGGGGFTGFGGGSAGGGGAGSRW